MLFAQFFLAVLTFAQNARASNFEVHSVHYEEDMDGSFEVRSGRKQSSVGAWIPALLDSHQDLGPGQLSFKISTRRTGQRRKPMQDDSKHWIPIAP